MATKVFDPILPITKLILDAEATATWKTAIDHEMVLGDVLCGWDTRMDLIKVMKKMLLSIKDPTTSIQRLVLAMVAGSTLLVIVYGMVSLRILSVAVSACQNSLYYCSGVQVTNPAFLGVVLLLVSSPIVLPAETRSTRLCALIYFARVSR
jgi:hypothetical protein